MRGRIASFAIGGAIARNRTKSAMQGQAEMQQPTISNATTTNGNRKIKKPTGSKCTKHNTNHNKILITR